MGNFFCPRGRRLRAKPLTDDVRGKHQRAPVMNVDHTPTARRCHNDKPLFAVILSVGFFTDRGKKERAIVPVVNEKRLFAFFLFLPFKSAICGHDGTSVVSQGLKHPPAGRRFPACVNQRLLIPPFRSVPPENRIEMLLLLPVIQQ